MGTSFTKLRIFFHKVSFITSTLFPPFRETLYDGRVTLVTEASEEGGWVQDQDCTF
jgi:hypothetical protein